MKFGKRLNKQIKDTLPEWRDKFLSYKDLKKLVRLISIVPVPGLDSKGEAEFIHLLHAEIEKFNSFFVEQEEDFIIRQKELKDRIQDVIDTVGPMGSRPSEAEYRVEMGNIRRDIVNFHGEMVLLENYSSINYTGLAKILKKYDKRTGHLLRLPFIESVLQQPFFTTDLISKLVKECETTMAVVFPNINEELKDVNDVDDDDPAEENGQETTVATEQGIFRSTVVALATMRELRGGSSTYSHLSLPPLVLPDADFLQFLQPSSPIPIQ